MTTNHEITPDELEAAARAIFYARREVAAADMDCDADDLLSFEESKSSNDSHEQVPHAEAMADAQAAITAFLECRNKKGQGDE